MIVKQNNKYTFKGNTISYRVSVFVLNYYFHKKEVFQRRFKYVLYTCI